jgi:hypothetical protein
VRGVVGRYGIVLSGAALTAGLVCDCILEGALTGTCGNEPVRFANERGVVDEEESRLINDLQVLVDKEASAAANSFDVMDADTLDEVQGLLEEYFSAPGAPEAVSLMFGATYVGVATRHTLEQSCRTAAEPGQASEVGVGERIQLAGVSTRYRLLKFVCPKCSAAVYRIHYDERNLPTCAKDSRMMELRREA